MMPFLTASAISLVLIIVSVVVFYEILARTWLQLPKLDGKPALQILLTILASFVGHTAAIWIFGLTYYELHQLGYGGLGGTTEHSLMDYIYFSSVSYSSLGLGDVFPLGDLRLLVAVEAILGLILVGWTVAYTYLFMDKYLVHRHKRHKSAKD